MVLLQSPIGSRYLLRMVLEVKVLPENGLGGSKDILRMVLDPYREWNLRNLVTCSSKCQ